MWKDFLSRNVALFLVFEGFDYQVLQRAEEQLSVQIHWAVFLLNFHESSLEDPQLIH